MKAPENPPPPVPTEPATAPAAPAQSDAIGLPRLAPFDMGPYRAACTVADEPATTVAALEGLLAECKAAEPELIKRASAGDLQAAAELTICRLKIHETYPPEIEAAKKRLADGAIAAWDATSDLLSQAIKYAINFTKPIDDLLLSKAREALRPFVEDVDDLNALKLIGVSSKSTAVGQVADMLSSELYRVSRDYDSSDRPWVRPGPPDKVYQGITAAEAFARQCNKSARRTERVLAIIERFNAEIVRVESGGPRPPRRSRRAAGSWS